MWEKVCAGMLGAMMITGTAAGVSAAEKGSVQPQVAVAPAAEKEQAAQRSPRRRSSGRTKVWDSRLIKAWLPRSARCSRITAAETITTVCRMGQIGFFSLVLMGTILHALAPACKGYIFSLRGGAKYGRIETHRERRLAT